MKQNGVGLLEQLHKKCVDSFEDYSIIYNAHGPSYAVIDPNGRPTLLIETNQGLKQITKNGKVREALLLLKGRL